MWWSRVANPHRFRLREEDRRGCCARQAGPRTRPGPPQGTHGSLVLFPVRLRLPWRIWALRVRVFPLSVRLLSVQLWRLRDGGTAATTGSGYRPVVVQVSERPADQRGRLVRGLGYVRGGDRGRSTAVGSDGGGMWSSGGSRSGGSSGRQPPPAATGAGPGSSTGTHRPPAWRAAAASGAGNPSGWRRKSAGR